MDISILKSSIKAHAESSFPHECCGLIIVHKGRLKYIKCTNLLQHGVDAFCISPIEYASAEELGEVVYVVHSHPHTKAIPSNADIVACNTSRIKWLIYSIVDTEFFELNPIEYVEPLIGRQFYHGVLDCYSLIRDYYRSELGIHLNDYLREPNWWDKDEYNLYTDNFKKEGFLVVQDLKKHDVILMQNGSDKVNHGGIYIGDSMILHHSANRLSSRDVYGGYWRKNTSYILRHRSLL